jgi:two-component system NtrC family sensor kinase
MLENLNAEPNAEPHSLQGKTILVVDDDSKVLQVTGMALEKEGYSVRTASTALEALQIMQQDSTDLILLDVCLPDGDGYELCKDFKGRDETRDIPIILLTALNGVDNKVRGLDVGASDYLVKPFLQKELLARIRTHLREREITREVRALYSIEKRRAHELAILNRLTTGFNRSLDPDELLRHATQVISTELNFHGCTLAIRDRNRQEFRVRASFHPTCQGDHESSTSILNTWLSVWNSGRATPMIIDDVSTDPAFPLNFPDSRSAMVVPLVHQETMIGVLMVESHRPRAYNEDDLNLLSTVAGNLTLALKNAELYSAAQLYSQNLRSEVNLRTLELQTQKKFMENIIDALPIGIYVVDDQYHVVTWNKKRETGILGISRDRVIGKNIFSVFSSMAPEKLKDEFDKVFSTGSTFETEAISFTSGEKRYYHLRKIPMSVDGSAITHVITLGEDITDRKRLEESLFTNEKLVSIGKLAAGIAHEINNPLAAISGCVEGLLSRSAEETLTRIQAFEDFPEYLKIIDDEIRRCKGIIDNLLNFSRAKELQQQEIRINDILEHTLQLLSHHKAFRQITVIKDLDSACPLIIGNNSELRQVFLAMAINAMDAMDARGTLTIRTGTEIRNGQTMVCVEFQDTGVGIPQQNLNKIFDPFFTTKAVGKGTGLGLSICYGIVRSHDGFIKVTSEVNKGSLFQIYFPAIPVKG